ncbi:MAG TPA: FG-GAP-like repeat-containing protein [Kofleriaceae bacterium]|nr:FG-GAP-like repeat-containing protein [Kofleriaceae bacterium]
MRGFALIPISISIAACSTARTRSQDIDAPISSPADAGVDASPPPDAAPVLGTSWPPSQQFPSFAPIVALDVIDGSGRAADVAAMLVTMQGVVNRTQPRIYVHDGGSGDQLWLDEISVPTTHVDDPFALVIKYKAELKGIVITDDALPDTLDLATTIAGQTDAIVASPALATTLTAPPYSLPVIADLRQQHFGSKLAVYQYELDHWSANATHRLIIGLTPSIPDHLRDYAVATRAMVVWLDPRNASEGQLLAQFLSLCPPNSPYLGWWLDEPAGVAAASSHGVPVYAADWSSNLTVLGGTTRGDFPAPIATAPPPLEPKLYVAMFMSDGDNLQEDQHLIPLKWKDGARGAAPIGWTINPALVDVAPIIMRYFERTATENDVLVSGPSGLGYTYPAAWPSGAFDSYAKVTGAYMKAAGLRTITVWNNGADLSDADAHSYTAHAPDLLGMTIQDESRALRWIDDRVPVVRMALSYGDSAAILESGVDNALGSFTGAAPQFIAIQGNMNMGAIAPQAFAEVQAHYAANTHVVFVRPDHFFQLLERATHRARHAVWAGDFDGDAKHRTDQLMYYAGDGAWWLGLSDGSSLTWQNAGNTSGFGDLLDGGHQIVTGDFNGDQKTDVMFHWAGDGNWWLGTSNGASLTWKLAGNSAGDLQDGAHRLFVGDYTGDGKTDLLVYAKSDGSWTMGVSDGTSLTWHSAGNSSGFGNLLDGSHPFFEGDWNGDGKRDLMFYYVGDGTWWMGLSSGSTIDWHSAVNTSGFGNLADRSHRVLVGDFDGDKKTDVMFHYAGDGAWWLGRSDGAAITWSKVATTTEPWLDWSHRIWTGDVDADGDDDLLIFDASASRWTFGVSSGTSIAFQTASTVPAYGNEIDPSRLLFIGDFDGDKKLEPELYVGADGTWWMSQSSGTTLTWHTAANTSGFGDLTR